MGDASGGSRERRGQLKDRGEEGEGGSVVNGWRNQ